MLSLAVSFEKQACSCFFFLYTVFVFNFILSLATFLAEQSLKFVFSRKGNTLNDASLFLVFFVMKWMNLILETLFCTHSEKRSIYLLGKTLFCLRMICEFQWLQNATWHVFCRQCHIVEGYNGLLIQIKSDFLIITISIFICTFLLCISVFLWGIATVTVYCCNHSFTNFSNISLFFSLELQ